MKSKRLIAVILSTLMVLSQLSIVSFATDEIAADAQSQPVVEQTTEDEAQPEEAKASDVDAAAQEKAEEVKTEEPAKVAISKKGAKATKKSAKKVKAFSQSKTVDGVKVSVKAAKAVDGIEIFGAKDVTELLK